MPVLYILDPAEFLRTLTDLSPDPATQAHHGGGEGATGATVPALLPFAFEFRVRVRSLSLVCRPVSSRGF